MNKNIAIDGPAGSGKSTIAKIIGERLNLMYINTGAMYRAITLKALRENISYTSVDKLEKLIEGTELYFEDDQLFMDGENISQEIILPETSNNVSNYAAVPKVRRMLVKKMQDMAKKFDVIMDGRDIGTVVLKDAEFKFFLSASAEERANRRFNEYKNNGVEVDYNELLEDIKRRDHIDSTRETDPLAKADDAIEIDSTKLTIDEVVEKIMNYVNK
ncbi:(d)CMP kinase [Oceanirhabdus sp. W0125-5]|uniref:(d)CMP kinase n=1 Tax=Oceanirhabdus sp. W0125-5 TaxID=2999116 RepID=UPI0022F343C0|nr:(d)CMP kinase [Oceanirhabdus sp. W0125-5]WBW95100.1 (d)CMP kinase [Oceanirhabdus sp. W0125-5]